jgi:hypothetical protein
MLNSFIILPAPTARNIHFVVIMPISLASTGKERIRYNYMNLYLEIAEHVVRGVDRAEDIECLERLQYITILFIVKAIIL